MTEYHNKIDECPIGDIYESVDTERGTIQKNDLVVWSDPDCHYHDENVQTSLFIGFVEKVYKVTGRHDNYDTKPELGTSMPLGRIPIDRNLTAISGKEIYDYIDGHKCDMKFIDRFLNSQYENYMNIEYTLSGSHRVSGN